ncbi:MAG: nuclear transport factor 2 family protein [Rhizomicrobium sp.]
MQGTDSLTALIEKYCRALEIGDKTALDECYAPDARVWNSMDRTDRAGQDHTKLQSEPVTGFFARYADRKYTEARVNLFDGGFVRQHVLTGFLEDGTKFSRPICLIGYVENGRIARIDEYLGTRLPK